MEEQKRRPFYKVLIGIICAMMAVGALMGMFAQFSIMRLLLFGVFVIWAIVCLAPAENDSKIRKKSPARKKMVFLRIAVFFAVWLVLGFIGALCFPPENNAAGIPVSSSTSMTFSFVGMLLGIVSAYFLPVPAKWKEQIVKDEKNAEEEEKEEEGIITEAILDDHDKAKDEAQVIYEKEDIDLE